MPAETAPETLWRVGRPNGDFHGFALADDLVDPHDGLLRTERADVLPDEVEFVVGRSRPDAHWPFIHPGPADEWAGGRPRSYAIAFEMAETSPACVELVIRYVDVCPDTDVDLQVQVNEEPACFHLPAGPSCDVLWRPEWGSHPVRRLRFDGRLLTRGWNRITLTNVQGGWTLYDCVELRTDPEGGVAPPWWIEDVVALPFYVRRGQGCRQLVEIRTVNLGRRRRVDAEVRVGDQCVRRDIMLPLGPGRATVEVPPWEGTVLANVVLEDASTQSQWDGPLEPGRHYTLYLVQHAHTKVGATHPQLQCAERHATNLDRAIRFCEQTEDWPEDSQFKWTVDASWTLEHFLNTRPPRQVERLLYWIQDGRIAIEAMYVHPLSGLCTAEELIRLLYTAGSVKHLYEVPLTTAMLTDVPGHSWFMPEVLMRSGVRHLSVAQGSRGGAFHANADLRVPAFYWEGPAGARVLTWLSRDDAEAARLGFRDGVDVAHQRLREWLCAYDRQDDPPDVVYLRAGFGANGLADLSQAETVREWNQRWAWPHVVIATSQQCFAELESRCRDRLPTRRGDWAGWWEDGAASAAIQTHVNRANHRVLAEAEKWLTLAMMLGLMEYPAGDLNQAYKHMILFDEHTWGASPEVIQRDPEQCDVQWQFKTDCCESARMISQRLLEEALEAIAAHVDREEPYCVVFNSSGFSRRDTVVVSMPRELFGQDNPRLMDMDTDEILPTQFLDDEEGSATCVVALPELPAVGFRVLGPSPETSGSGPTLAVADELVNDWYRLRVDPATGSVVSLHDKMLRCELVDGDSPYGFGSFVYHRGPAGAAREYRPCEAELLPGVRGPVFDELVVRYRCGPCQPIDLRIWLYHTLKKVELRWWIEKEPTDEKEAGYLTFPFHVPDGVFHAEVAGAIMQPERDQLAGACRDWYPVQNWVGCANGRVGVLLGVGGAPLVQFGGITTGRWAKHLDARRSTVVGYVFNNYWPVNFPPAQAGPLHITYALTSYPGPFDPVLATQFGEGFSDPATVAVGGKPGTDPVLPCQSASLLTIEPEHVRLVTVKQAESGNPVLLRLQELSGQHTTARVTLGFTRMGSAEVADYLEEPTHPLTVEDNTAIVELDPYEVVTVLLYPAEEEDGTDVDMGMEAEEPQ